MKRLKASWPILLIAALTAFAPLAATAEDDPISSELDRERWLEKGLTYAACAASIVFASTGATITAAVITCSAAINYWFTE